MKKYWPYLTLLLILALAVYLRTTNLLGRLDYGWDQARDLTVIREALSTHTLPLLGPIARGEIGGFYLAPYYYYLLIPFYYLTGASLIALSAFSILADLSVIALVFFLFRTHWGTTTSLITGGIWAASTLVIANALTPWNVSLIPLWTLLVLWLLTPAKLSLLRRLTTLFVLGLSSSIHLTLIPIALVLAVVNFRRLLPHKLSELGFYLAALTLPQLPLVIYDLTHNLDNLRAIHRYYLITRLSPPADGFLPTFISKLDLTFSRLFFSHPYPGFGLGILALSVLSPLLFRSKLPANLTTILAANLIIVALYHDPDFAEYYLNPSLFPTVLLTTLLLKRLHHLLPLGLLLATLIFSRLHFEPITNNYSLLRKQELAAALAAYTPQAEVRVDVAKGRGIGITDYLLELSFDNNSAHPLKAIVTDSSVVTYPAPEEARSVVYDQVVGGLKLIVFSN